MKQELLSFLEHLSSLSEWGSRYPIFSFICNVCRSLFVILSFFCCLLYCLSDLPNLDYPFNIFKLLLLCNTFPVCWLSPCYCLVFYVVFLFCLSSFCDYCPMFPVSPGGSFLIVPSVFSKHLFSTSFILYLRYSLKYTHVS